MAQKCVFCGNKPRNKNKEHIIPQWLSKYLGCYKSICYMPRITDLKLTFAQLTFPACEKCNSMDSNLEGAAKTIIEKMMSQQSVTGQEISTLMDWFDKLRIGLWLGQLTLQKRLDLINPNFYINNRIATKDRMLIIERFNGPGNGLAMIGNDTTMFSYAPCAFQVWFNDVLITNASTDGLVGNKLGFPILSKQHSVSYRQNSGTLSKGTNKTTHPVVMNIDGNYKTVIYQPIFKELIPHDFYDVPYVHQHCYDYDAGLGGVFVQKNGNTIKYMKPDDKLNLLPKKQTENTEVKSTKRVFELQNHITSKLHNLSEYNQEDQNFIKVCMLENQALINSLVKTK